MDPFIHDDGDDCNDDCDGDDCNDDDGSWAFNNVECEGELI